MTARFSPLAAEKGRDIVIFDQDRDVRLLEALAPADPRDGLSRDSIGSFGRLHEASSTGHAYATVVRGPTGHTECRIAPPDPDASFVTSLGRRLGVWDVNPAKLGVDFGAEELHRYILYHEIAHCLDEDAFTVRDLAHARHVEARADAFAVLAVMRDGAPPNFLRQMADLRAIYMREMARHYGGSPHVNSRSDAAIAKMPHLIYWMENVYRSLEPYAAGAGSLSDRDMLAIAHHAADAGRLSSKQIIAIHRALAGEAGWENPSIERIVVDAYARLGRDGWRGAAHAVSTFDVDAWEVDFAASLRKKSRLGFTPEAVIAEERDRLRERMAYTARMPEAKAIESALRQVGEIAREGYAGIVDPPLVVLSGQEPLRPTLERPELAEQGHRSPSEQPAVASSSKHEGASRVAALPSSLTGLPGPSDAGARSDASLSPMTASKSGTVTGTPVGKPPRRW